VALPLDKFVCSVEDDCPRNCSCIKRPSNLTFSVSCQVESDGSVPERLPNPNYPPPRVGRMYLDFHGSNINTLKYRHFWNKTTSIRSIDLSRSNIYSVQKRVWRVLTQIGHVDLSGNQLTVLPRFFASENVTFRWLAVYENPLRCSCEDKWIRDWLLSLGNGLFTPYYNPSAQCGSPNRLTGKNVLQLTDEDFCPEPSPELPVTRVPEIIAEVRYLKNRCQAKKRRFWKKKF